MRPRRTGRNSRCVLFPAGGGLDITRLSRYPLARCIGARCQVQPRCKVRGCMRRYEAQIEVQLAHIVRKQSSALHQTCQLPSLRFARVWNRFVRPLFENCCLYRPVKSLTQHHPQVSWLKAFRLADWTCP